jgi:hypothetical protein
MALTLTISSLTFGQQLTGSPPMTVNIFYKYYLDSMFTLVAANVPVTPDPTNPYIGTLPSSPPIQITGLSSNTQYVVEAINDMCGVVYSEMFNYPCANGCPPGFSIDPTGSFCQSIQTVVASPPTASQNAVSVTDNLYETCGAFIFAPGYNVNGTGTATQISTSNAFWTNGPGTCGSGGTTSGGRMNTIAVWMPTPEPGQVVGYSQCFTLTEETTVYIFFGADNYGTLQVDGTNIIVQDPTAMDAQFGTTSGQATFQAACIYPLTLGIGLHAVAMLGTNGPGAEPGNPGMIACEIYGNTATEIAAATSAADLNIIFSTANVVGLPIQIGTAGYNCPDGYTLSACASPPNCQRTVTAPIIC